MAKALRNGLAISLFASLLILQPAAHGAQCVSEKQYKMLKKGMTKAKVKSITKNRGGLLRVLSVDKGDAVNGEVFEYGPLCMSSPNGVLYVTFVDGKLNKKEKGSVLGVS